MSTSLERKLQEKLSRQRKLGERTPPEVEAAIVAEYAASGSGYRTLAKKHHVGLGTVMRIIHRHESGKPREQGKTETLAEAFQRRGKLLNEALTLLDGRTGRRRALCEEIRKELAL